MPDWLSANWLAADWLAADWLAADWLAADTLAAGASWRYASVALAAVLAGWLSHRLLVSLASRPGAKAATRLERFAERALLGLASLEEIAERLEPGQVAGQVIKVIGPRLRRLADEILLEQDADLWRATPDLVKQRIYANLEAALPRRVELLVREAHRTIGELADYRHLALQRLGTDRALRERIAAALRPFGSLLPPGRERREEAAAAWCRLAATEIVTARAIVQEMLEGPFKEKTEALIRRHLEPIVDDGIGSFKTGLEVALGRGTIIELREAVGRRAAQVAAQPFADWHFNRERAERVELLLRELIAALPPEELRQRLRPPFGEGEAKRLLAAAALGLLAGWAQAALVFGL